VVVLDLADLGCLVVSIDSSQFLDDSPQFILQILDLNQNPLLFPRQDSNREFRFSQVFPLSNCSFLRFQTCVANKH
jgi:hypothetical protein